MALQNKKEDIGYSPKVIGNESIPNIETVGIEPTAMFGSIYDARILDGLETLKEYINMADVNEPDTRNALEEILEQLKDKLGE